jgi:AcrR family transcriptional regulator
LCYKFAVARPTDLAARHALLDDVVEYLGEHGLAETTLRPMAAALGTTPTRLMHHFGSKGQLIAAALYRVDEVQRQIEARWVARDPQMTQSDILRAWWRWMLGSRKNRNLARLSIEAATLDPGVTGLDDTVRADRMGAWRTNIERRLLAAGLGAHEARVLASVLEASFTGLMVDYLSGGERARLSDALEWILDDHERRLAQLLGANS